MHVILKMSFEISNKDSSTFSDEGDLLNLII